MCWNPSSLGTGLMIGQLHSQHMNGSHGNVLQFKDEVHLKKQIIQLFSFDAQTVIDADPMNGLS